MTAKNKKKPKKITNQPNTSLAKRQRAILKALENKEQNQPKTELPFWKKVWSYKNWIPIPVVVALIVAWFSYYPENLIVSEKKIGVKFPLSNSIIIHNSNRYGIDDINVKVKFKGGYVLDGHSIISDMETESNYKIYELPSNKSKGVNAIMIEGYTVTALAESTIEIILTYDTPFLYPNVKADRFKFKTILNRQNEVIYIPD